MSRGILASPDHTGIRRFLRVHNGRSATRLRAQCLQWIAMIRAAGRNQVALVFACCCASIAAISVHDAILVILYCDSINQLERNPVGRWLLETDGGDVRLFIAVKFAGTAIVCTVLVRLYRYRRHLGMLAVVVLTCFQLLLLLHLHYG